MEGIDRERRVALITRRIESLLRENHDPEGRPIFYLPDDHKPWHAAAPGLELLTSSIAVTPLTWEGLRHELRRYREVADAGERAPGIAFPIPADGVGIDLNYPFCLPCAAMIGIPRYRGVPIWIGHEGVDCAGCGARIVAVP